MKMIKKIAAICMITVFSLSLVACGNKQTVSPSAPIAKVGETEITRESYDEQLAYLDSIMEWQFGKDYKNNQDAMTYYESQKQDIIDFLVETEVLLQKAKASNIEVSEEDINEELETTKAGFESEEAFNAALQESKLTLDDLKENIKSNLLISKTIEQYTSDITVNDEEIEAYYNENLANYTKPAGAEMAHVLLENEAEAKKAKKAYDEGTSTFEDLAAKYNTDSTKDLGGSLGFVAYDAEGYDKDFLAAAKALKEGEVSDPVKSSFGWHLIKVNNIQPEPTVSPLSQVKETVSSTVLYNKQSEKLEEQLKTWKSEFKVELIEDNLK